ncbi:hypothetical protein [Colwellia sp. RSH04]|uniref:hypothetical protein n=1 Tax=Colwellia sp. RSH04 TaxID=2305464 RepID=UPI000E57E1DC|nr:hypothetical protein [Colwellia sp. RSH04]RHW77427.1 hypothetical protein D1094_00225 [Colwellia sp. RSH04]
MNSRKVNIESRNEQFSTKIKSRITLEIPSDDNEFLAQQTYTHGYNVLDLMDHCDPIDNLFLIFKGELPNAIEKKILTKLSIFLMNQGPRTIAARTGANAGVGRTDVNHILPIAIMGMSGNYGGSKEVENAMRFVHRNVDKDAANVAKQCLADKPDDVEGDWIIAPGFGTDFRGQSPFLLDVKDKFMQACPDNGYLAWCQKFINALPAEKNCGWRLASIVAGVLLDLGIPARVGAGLFQLLASPTAFAHGVSFADKPITEIPFLKDEDYEIKPI